VERENKQRWEQIAKNCGVSSAALFDVMVETVELDAHGRPVWFPDTEGLPIDAPERQRPAARSDGPKSVPEPPEVWRRKRF
jgi:hypothetical protein